MDLLIKALTHTLYAGIDRMEPPEWMIERMKKESGEAWTFFAHNRERAEGRDWPLYAQSMIGLKRMQNLRECTETVLEEGVSGDLIEAGVWRGGAAILMRGILKAYGVEDRLVWAADSFQGLPPPDPARYPADQSSFLHEVDLLAVPLEEVRENFRRYGLLDNRVRFVEGWFRETLPELCGHSWALIRLDGDLYESTMDALVNLYDGLSPGGFLIIDDFWLPQCHEAVEDFRRDRGIEDPVEQIDWAGAFWRKAA